MIDRLGLFVTGARLRPYQEQAVEACAAALVGGGRATVVMACGTGKTLVGMHAAGRLVPQGGRVLLVAPSLALIEQTYRAWRAEVAGEFVAAAFCTADLATAEDLSVRDLRVPMVTTDPQALAAWDAANPQVTKVVLATYRSTPVLAQTREEMPAWDLVICDEAHRTAGEAGADYATVLHEEKIPARCRLFLTATPRLHDLDRDDDVVVASMDDPEIYGEHVYAYTLREAIDDGWLSEYVVVVAVTTGTGEDLSGRVRYAQGVHIGRGRSVASSAVAAATAVLRAAGEHHVRRAVSFHGTVASARNFAMVVPAVAGLIDDVPATQAAVTWGGQDGTQRAAVLAGLIAGGEGLHLVTNARVLAEGVDVPTLDAVILAEPRTSPIEVTQIVGRAIRRNPERERPSVVIVPVVVPEGDDVDDRLARTDFRGTLQTIRALAEHDPTLLQRIGLPPGYSTGPSDRGHPVRIEIHLDPASPRIDDLTWTSRIRAMLLARSGASWYARAQALANFVEQHGRWPRDDYAATPEEAPLARWLYEQRAATAQARMTPERRAWLDQHVDGWDQGRDEQWTSQLERLAAFVAAHDRLPAMHADSTAEDSLAQWLSKQRAGRERLAAERRDALDQAAPQWDDPIGARWTRTAAEVADWVREHGRTPRSSGPTVPIQEAVLGRWLYGQRKDLPRMDPARQAWLDEHAPGWRATREERWWEQARAWQAHAELHGRTPRTGGPTVPNEEIALGIWRRNQDHRHNLTTEQTTWLDHHQPTRRPR